MHERAAVTRAIGDLLRVTGGRVSQVYATFGPGVDPGVVQGIWDETVRDTPAASAELTCEQAMDLLRCLDCEAEYGGSRLDTCPGCGGIGLVVRNAPEFAVHDWVATG